MTILLRLCLLSSLYLLMASIEAQTVFKAFWNVASDRCQKKKVDIPLSQFDIVHNRDQKFFGEKIVLFYETQFGLFPYYNNSDPNQPVNGGLPQNASLPRHLHEVIKQILIKIPDPWFPGLAVIDFEAWRPLYEMNWGKKKVYKEQSVKLVMAEDPRLTRKLAEALARRDFNEAARNFFVETLKVAQDLRPKARWGYYHYPFCNYKGNHSNFSCTQEAMEYNNKLSFIYNASKALYPSIYLDGQKSLEESFRYVQAVIAETKRIAEHQTPPLKFYMYTKFEYNPYKKFDWFYNKSDLCNTLRQSADLGANGVVLWSTTKNIVKRCNNIADYIRHTLGPWVF